MVLCLRKTGIIFIILTILFQSLGIGISHAANESLYGLPVDYDLDKNNSYSNYIERYKNAVSPNKEIVIPADTYSNAQDSSVKISSYDGKNNVLLLPAQPVWVEWSFDVEQEGLYNICISYNPGTDANNDLEMELNINGETPFNEALYCKLLRVWKNETEILRDDRDNDLRPRMKQKAVWLEYDVKDSQGLHQEPFQFYFNKGRNTIRLVSSGEPFIIEKIKLYQKPEIKSYNEVSKSYPDKKISNVMVKVQAENAALRSSATLYPITDRTDPLTEPSSASKIRLNAIGGSNWKYPGQWISWQFDVPEDGLYEIAVKYRQSYLNGLFSCRKIMIDGSVPFSELESVQFPYDDNWKIKVLGEENPYLFYLEKGSHVISMEAVLGDMTDVIREYENIIYDLNELYRKIIMITGTDPDQYRDYFLEKQIPDLIPSLTNTSAAIRDNLKKLISIIGKKGSDTAVIERLAIQLEDFAEKPETIATRLESFKNNISSLSSFIFKIKEQPLDLDYLIVATPDQKLPKAQPNLWQSLSYGIKSFLASFTEDYSLLSNTNKQGKRSVKVWVSLGRDQAGILKDMITDLFTPQTGIDVQLELVQGSLIEATLAGRGPDVALMVASGDPVNYAIRGALVDLRSFDDFDRVAERFYPSAFTPFEFKGGCYALPETQVYDMLFYRKDILKELGLGIPQTWEQFKNIIPIIQKNNMTIGLPVPVVNSIPGQSDTLFPAFLFQRGGTYYKDNLKETNFDSPEALEAFEEITDFYTRYDFPVEYNFYSRFRTGEMPIGIQPYNTYNMISVGAPELKGMWDMAPIPGTIDENGQLNRAEASRATACIMFKNTKDKEAAWEFLKFFTSAEAQARYGLELEALMGASARHATANKEAFNDLPWTRKEKVNLLEQWKQIQGIPEVPGSYYTSRGFINAFRTTVYNNANSNEALLTQNRDINYEIQRKYEEFGIE